jgi:DNA-binding HxlR family transcriptional regulator
MYDYNEACPISMGASVLCEKWTLQIIREMIFGVSRYSEFQKYMPNISPSLLRNRLRHLEDQGVIRRKRSASGNRYEYFLTPAGEALAPVLTEIGKWGFRWKRERMTEKQNAASVLIRDFAGGINIGELPACAAVLELQFTDTEDAAHGFIHIQDGAARVCDTNLGFDSDVIIRSPIRALTRIWYGELGLESAIQSGEVKVSGMPAFERSIGRWLGISSFNSDNPSIKR